MQSRWNNGMLECWNVGLNKELIHFIASLSRGILPIDQYTIFLEPIIPSFHYSNIPIVPARHRSRSGEFPNSGFRHSEFGSGRERSELSSIKFTTTSLKKYSKENITISPPFKAAP
jgi:hypothetical protein